MIVWTDTLFTDSFISEENNDVSYLETNTTFLDTLLLLSGVELGVSYETTG